MKGSLVFLSGLFAGALAIPTSNHVVHEKRSSSTQGRWVKRHALDADTKVPVRIALKQRNLDKGMDYLMEVSDPNSKSYGKHYTPDQVVELFAPDDESVKTVRDWLVASGIPDSAISVPKSKGWVYVDTTVGKLESVLNTRYHAYDHVESRNEHVGTDEYSLPSGVSQHVDFITPGVVFAPRGSGGKEKRTLDKGVTKKTRPLPKELVAKLARDPQSTEHCDTAITPACIKAMYKIPDGKLSDDSNRLGMFELDQQKYAQKDLDQFYKAFSPNIPAGFGPKVYGIDGGSAPGPVSKAGGEADLDFDIAIPLIYPQGTVLYQTVSNGDDIFNTFLDAVDGSYCTYSAYGETGDDPTVDGSTPNEQCGAFTPANVISFSYGTAEADYPAYYLQRQCDEFMKLGLQGTTLVMSSGDDGVARRSGPCLGPNQDIFTPDTAANCPYVTAVGSTVLPEGRQVGDAEEATSTFSSGGGFSNIFTTPDYQKTAVANYLANHDPGYQSYQTSNGTIPTDGGIYNSAGRGYPDLAAVGDKGVVVVRGKQSLSGGTSMSAPLVAGIFTRINDERIKAGKGPIGFVNPTLYAHPEMFNDVTVGNQDKGGPNGDSEPSQCGNSGFSAVEGWDPVTGLGTPNYPAFLDVFMSI